MSPRCRASSYDERCERADRPAAAVKSSAARRTAIPRFSISQVSTLGAGFAEDLDAYRAAAIDAIGIWELKLGDDSLDLFRMSGLGAASAVPDIPSIHPLPLLPGPVDPRERVE